MTITTTHKLLTRAWTAAVESVETAVGRFRTDHATSNDCQVVLFEMERDGHLHVNVTHKYPTKSIAGWAGPGACRRDSSTIAGSAKRSRPARLCGTFATWSLPLRFERPRVAAELRRSSPPAKRTAVLF
jgi:hypothetical protein